MSTAALDAATCSEFNGINMLYKTDTGCGLNQYSVLTDWFNAGFDGCPNSLSTAERVVIAVTDNTGMYAVISRSSNGADWTNLDDVPTRAAAAIPSGVNSTLTSLPGADPAVLTINLQNLPADGLGGYAAADAPGGNVITGWRAYSKNSAGVPADLNISSGAWISTGSTTAGPTSASLAGVSVALPPGGQVRYVAFAPVFDGGFVGANVGTPLSTVGPTAAGVFASFAASGSGTTVTTNWTSNVETDVVSYQPMWAPALSGPFKNGGSTVAPKGNGQAYTSSFGVPALKSGSVVYVKVRANKAGGGYEDTQVRKVLLGGAGPVA